MTSKSTATEAPSIIPDELAAVWMMMDEACQTLRRSRYTVDRLVEEGILEKIRYGRHVLISRESVKRHLARFLPSPPAAATSGRRRAR